MKEKNEIIDYSKFNERFPSEETCLDYLVSIRWSDGYCCPRCGCKEMWQINSYKYKCRKCDYQTSVTAGTLFHHTHISMRQWFQAIWYMSVQGNKATASELMKELEIGSNRTALSIIHKIKSEMFTTDSKKINRRLKGTIDVCIKVKYKILIAVEVENRKKGHIKLYRMPRYDKECFRQFILENVEKGSTIKKEYGHRALGYEIDGYNFKTIHPESYKAPYANEIFQNFIKYHNQKRNENKENTTSKIMNEYVRLMNSFTYDISFDEIIYNFLTYKARVHPFKF